MIRIRLNGGASRNSIKPGNFAPYSKAVIMPKHKATSVTICAPSAVVPGIRRDGVMMTTTIINARKSAPTNLVITASTSNLVSVHANTVILSSGPLRGEIRPISCELVRKHAMRAHSCHICAQFARSSQRKTALTQKGRAALRCRKVTGLRHRDWCSEVPRPKVAPGLPSLQTHQLLRLFPS